MSARGLLHRTLGIVAALTLAASAAAEPAASPAGSPEAPRGAGERVGVEGEAALRAVDPSLAQPDPAAVVPNPLGAVVQAALPAAAPPAPRSDLERAWLSGDRDVSGRATASRRTAVELGVRNHGTASRALLSPEARALDSGTRLGRAMLAVRLAPDLPFARIELARAYWDEGERLAAFESTLAALRAIPGDLEATFWLASSLLVIFALVLVGGSLAYIGLVGTSVVSHAAHDLGDLFGGGMPGFSRAALLGSLALLPLALGEGLLGVVLFLFALGFAYGRTGQAMPLALAGVLVVLGMYPVTQLAGRALTALESDPVANAVLAVSRDMASPAELALLRAESAENDLAAQALAVHARRQGDAQGAFDRYLELQQRVPRDPVVLANLGSLRFRRGEVEAAVDLYVRSAGLIDSPSLLFNLSQAYALSFRMDEFEGALEAAQLLGSDDVAELSRLGDPDFVADLPIPTARIREDLIRSSDGAAFTETLARPLAPGVLGDSWGATAIGFAAAAALGLVVGGRYGHSSKCARCGARICARCDGTVWSSDTCDGCHMLFHRPESTDSNMRMARLTALRNREIRLGRLATLSSLLVPGAAGLLARRPDIAFLGILCASWALAAGIWRHGIVPDPLAAGAAGVLAILLTSALAAVGYCATVAAGMLIRRRL